MEKNTKIILTFVLALIFAVATYAHIKYRVGMDYAVTFDGPCAPTEESCFVAHCDPEYEECTGNPQDDISYYKLFTKRAHDLPLCDPHDEDCRATLCVPQDECEVQYCDASDPEQECASPESLPAAESADLEGAEQGGDSGEATE